jgi:hypothetical protein
MNEDIRRRFDFGSGRKPLTNHSSVMLAAPR